jgi:large subunit ribosomal protein L14
MIKVGSTLIVLDNCGGRRVKCIKLFNKMPNSYSSVGDIILVSLKTLRRIIKKKKVKKNTMYLGVIVSTKKHVKRLNGVSVNSLFNYVVILNKEKNIIGKRIRGCVFHELRFKGFSKVISIAEGVL